VSFKVGGVFVTGTTGEFIALNPTERRQVISDATKFIAGRTKVIIQVCSYNTAESVALVKHARAQGVDGIASLPPYFHPMDDEAQYRYFSVLCEATAGTHFYLYNLPAFAANAISLDVIQRLKTAFPHLAGIKDSSGDMDRFKEELTMKLPDFQVICGADHQTLTSLRMGGKASVTSTANVFPEVFQAVYSAFESGDSAAAERAQEKLTSLTKALISGRYLATYKTALGLRGVDVGTVRPPHRELSTSEAATVATGLRGLGLIE
jgi:dihydrodipicolinate synthase/N-acetylneuraminate lyase